jgi:26S proteasome regulatory subunit T5
MKSEHQRLSHEQMHMTGKIKDNTDKIENNRQLPYLVCSYLINISDGKGNVIEILDMDTAAGAEEEGSPGPVIAYLRSRRQCGSQ